nr:FtsW/RodA/SpoVE family cell cycle protein [uncultured Anaerobutyricum sp.]
MMNKYLDILKEKSFWGNIGTIFLLECLLGIIVKIKYGNLDAYIGLLLPMLAVVIVIFWYGTYKKADYIFLVICVVLQMMGIMMQCIIQKSKAGFALKEQILLMVALVGAIAFMILYSKVLMKLSEDLKFKLLIAITVVTYIVLLIFGKDTGGAKAWLLIGGFSIQPTEFIKLFAIFFFTLTFCNDEWEDKEKIKYGVGFLIINGICSVLIGEMGSFLIMLTVFMVYVILFLSSLKYAVIFVGAGVGVGGIGFGIGKLCTLYATKKNITGGVIAKLANKFDLIMNRFNGLFHPEKVYQTFAARQGMALGGLLGNGMKSTVDIPVSESDYIFPEIIMNIGLLCGVLIVILFAVLFIFGVRMYLKQTDYRNMGLIVGSLFYITVQSFLMFFGSTGFFIMTGVPISFISDGGTAMMVTFIMIGLIINANDNEYPVSGNREKKVVWKDENGTEYVDSEL